MADIVDAAECASGSITEDESRRMWNCPKYLWPVRALCYPDYLLYWLGMMISFTGSWAQNLAMSWLILDLTAVEPYIRHQGLYLGVVAACSTVPFVVLALPAGVIADRFSKRSVTLITQSLAMVQAGLLCALVYFHMIQVWHVLALATFGGIVSAMDVPARQSMVGDLVGKQDLTNAVALGSLSFNGARIFGPVVGALLLSHFGAAMCFGVNALSFIAALIGLALIRTKTGVTRSKDTKMLPEVIEGFRYVSSTAIVRDLLLMTMLVCVFGMQYATVLPLWVKNVLHQNAKVLSVMMSCTGGGAALGALVVAAIGHRFRQGRVVLLGALFFSSSLIVFSTTANTYMSAVMLCFVGFGMMLFLSVSNSAIQMASPDRLRGRVLSIRSLMFMGVAPPIGALLIGFLTDHAGVRISVLLAGFVCLFTGIVFAVASKAVRNAA